MILLIVEHFILVLVTLMLVGIYFRSGFHETLRLLILALRQIPGVQTHFDIDFSLKTKLTTTDSGIPIAVTLPTEGLSKDVLATRLKELKERDTKGLDNESKVFAYPYTVAEERFQVQKEVMDTFKDKMGISADHDQMVRFFHNVFLKENVLTPLVVPSLRTMETEVIAMTAAFMHGDSEAAGFLTSGGTESVMVAVLAYRDWARKKWPWITKPEIVCPSTQHPCLNKAAYYFNIKVVMVPVTDDHTADVHAMEKAINPNTILVACSAPQYAHGIVDPIEEVSNMAAKNGLPCHVDACFGGYMLPWIEKLGYHVPKWDFRCPGVTSISADVHKYGFCVKGASAVVYRSDEYRRHQIYTYSSWPGGLYASTTMAGSRPGANIAAAWASLTFLGESGYMEKAQELMEIATKMKEGIASVQGLNIIGTPHMTCFAVTSVDPEVDIMAVADLMEESGWTMERLSSPNACHCTIMPHHKVSYQTFIDDIRNCTAVAKGNKQLSKKGTAGMYGIIGAIPDDTIVDDFLTEFFAAVYRVR